MSRPVITVSEDTDTGEVARLLRAYRIKRVPVVRNGQVVGIVSRENLLRALAEQEAPHGARPHSATGRAGLLAGALAELDRHFEHPTPGERAARRANARSRRHKSSRRRISSGSSRITKARKRSIARSCIITQRKSGAAGCRSLSTGISRMRAGAIWFIRRASRPNTEKRSSCSCASRAKLCSDGGRTLNAGRTGLAGNIARRGGGAVSALERDLKPHGFHLVARVLEFPGGFPGDAGAFPRLGAVTTV